MRHPPSRSPSLDPGCCPKGVWDRPAPEDLGGRPLPVALVTAYRPRMSLPPDQPPPSEKPKMSAEERRAWHADRLTTIRLRMAIGRELDDRDITTPAAIGEVLG